MKRLINLHLALTIGLGLIFLLLRALNGATVSPVHAANLLRPASALGDVLCVALEGGSYPGSCTRVFTNVQAAVDAASGGEIIKVAMGVYTDINTYGELRQIVYISKTVTIQGGYTITNWTKPYPITQPTTLDAQGQGRVLSIIGNISPTIEGVRVTGGNIAEWGNTPHERNSGGGIYLITATATLSNNQIFSNTSRFGGGLYLQSSAAQLNNNTIISNASNNGSGLYLNHSKAMLRGNNINTNTSIGGGGGLYLYYSPATLDNNTVSNNIARGSEGGGGLYSSHSDTTLNGNTIVANTAQNGGGLEIWWGAPTLCRNTIASNTIAYGQGGGLYLGSSDATLNENIIVSNTTGTGLGGGLYLQNSPAMLNKNTIAFNIAGSEGGGLSLASHSTATLSSNLIISNSAEYGGGLTLKGSNATLVNNVIADNQCTGEGSGLYIAASSPRLLHTTFARNRGGFNPSGIYLAWGGQPWDSTVVLTNTILISHTIGVFASYDTGIVTLNGVLWYDNETNTSGTGIIMVTREITGDPAFAIDGYHLTANSAAIDAGVIAGVPADIDNQPRPYQAPDLGADEYWPPGALKYVYLPVVLRQP